MLLGDANFGISFNYRAYIPLASNMDACSVIICKLTLMNAPMPEVAILVEAATHAKILVGRYDRRVHILAVAEINLLKKATMIKIKTNLAMSDVKLLLVVEHARFLDLQSHLRRSKEAEASIWSEVGALMRRMKELVEENGFPNQGRIKLKEWLAYETARFRETRTATVHRNIQEALELVYSCRAAQLAKIRDAYDRTYAHYKGWTYGINHAYMSTE